MLVLNEGKQMSKCKFGFKLTRNLDGLSDKAFDELLDHSAECPIHEGILADYERSILPLLRAALPEKVISPSSSPSMVSVDVICGKMFTKLFDYLDRFHSVYRFWPTLKSRLSSQAPIICCILSLLLFGSAIIVGLISFLNSESQPTLSFGPGSSKDQLPGSLMEALISFIILMVIPYSVTIFSLLPRDNRLYKILFQFTRLKMI
jgi:hypothetical protein